MPWIYIWKWNVNMCIYVLCFVPFWLTLSICTWQNFWQCIGRAPGIWVRPPVGLMGDVFRAEPLADFLTVPRVGLGPQAATALTELTRRTHETGVPPHRSGSACASPGPRGSRSCAVRSRQQAAWHRSFASGAWGPHEEVQGPQGGGTRLCVQCTCVHMHVHVHTLFLSHFSEQKCDFARYISFFRVL